MKNQFKIWLGLLVFSLSLGAFSPKAASAFEEDAECLDRKHKFSDCKIILRDNLLEIEYDDDDDADLNLMISLDRVSYAASLRYFTSGFFEASGVQFGIFIDYLDDESQTQMKVLEIDPRKGFIFLSLLRQHGVEVNWNLLRE